MGKLLKNSFVIIILILVVVSVAYVAFAKLYKPSAGHFDWKIVQVKDPKNPTYYEVDVYLTGEKVAETEAVEVNAAVGSPLLQLASVEPGTFFSNPLIIKMDNQDLIFAIAKNPTSQTTVDPTQPVFKLHFTAKSGFSQSTFNILSSSQIYIKNIGGATPSSTEFVVQK